LHRIGCLDILTSISRDILWGSMGKPLMIQEDDNRRIEELKKRLSARSKVDVVRAGLALLEREAERQARVERWRRAARLAGPSSRAVNAEFRQHSRLKKV
jgi:Arc/MetJ-type ribon-helix-helix transcriptional regulator